MVKIFVKPDVSTLSCALQWMKPGQYRLRSGGISGLLLTGLLTTACGDLVYLFPQNNRNNSIDIQISDANQGIETSFKLSDEEGYFASETGAYQFSWPAFDAYGQASEFAYIYFLPLIPGVQSLSGGQITNAAGSWSLLGQQVAFDVRWEGSRSFPFVHTGTFLGTAQGGVTVTGDFTLSNMNCLADVFDYDSEYECGLSFEAGGHHELTWSQRSDMSGCPQSVVDAFLGTERDGSVSESRLELGELSMPCVGGYNNRFMCGQNPVEVEAEGCSWKVLGRGGPSGYSEEVVSGWLFVTASFECTGDVQMEGMCQTGFSGTPVN